MAFLIEWIAVLFFGVSAQAALPPNNEIPEINTQPQVAIICGYQIVAIYAVMDFVTKEPLAALSNEYIPIGTLPYPCPTGINQ